MNSVLSRGSRTAALLEFRLHCRLLDQNTSGAEEMRTETIRRVAFVLVLTLPPPRGGAIAGPVAPPPALPNSASAGNWNAADPDRRLLGIPVPACGVLYLETDAPRF